MSSAFFLKKNKRKEKNVQQGKFKEPEGKKRITLPTWNNFKAQCPFLTR